MAPPDEPVPQASPDGVVVADLAAESRGLGGVRRPRSSGPPRMEEVLPSVVPGVPADQRRLGDWVLLVAQDGVRSMGVAEEPLGRWGHKDGKQPAGTPAPRGLRWRVSRPRPGALARSLNFRQDRGVVKADIEVVRGAVPGSPSTARRGRATRRLCVRFSPGRRSLRRPPGAISQRPTGPGRSCAPDCRRYGRTSCTGRLARPV